MAKILFWFHAGVGRIGGIKLFPMQTLSCFLSLELHRLSYSIYD